MPQHDHTPEQKQSIPEKLEGVEVTPEDLAALESGPEGSRDLGHAAFQAIGETPPPLLEIEGDEDDTFVEALRNLRDKLGLPEDATVIYPGSATHVGVARVFGKENVTHVDPDANATRVLEKYGYDAVAQGISEYKPKTPADVIVALNSYGELREEDVKRLLKEHGYLIANNYTHWAADAAQLKELKLKAAILPSYHGGEYREGPDIPEGATDIVMQYYNISRTGGIEKGTPEDHTFADDTPRYPDALFVFQRVA